jgi:hypothetical protein
MEKINDPVEDIVGEAEISVRTAYQRGYEHGKIVQGNVNAKLSNPNLILIDFIKFIKKYKMTSIDGEIRFSDNDYVYFDENLIARFLLIYDYEND